MRFDRRRGLLLLAFAAAGALFFSLYWRSLPFPYEFDDVSNVIENRAIRYLLHPRIFIESEHARTRPLTTLGFALSYAISGMSLTALRLPSLFLHFFSSVLVALLFARWFRREPGAGRAAVLAGAVFLLHPIATDSVVYLSGRASLQVLFFLLLALWFYGRERPGFFSWLGFLLAAAAAMISKESAVVLLPILIVYHLLLKRRWWEILPFVWPIAAAGAAWAIVKWNYFVVVSYGIFQIAGQADVHSFFDYLPIGLAQWPMIVWLFFRPDLQSIDHLLHVPASWADPAVLGGIAIWCVLPILLYRVLRYRSPVAFAGAWLFLSLLVTNSIFPMLDPLAERHMYLALPSLAWLVAAAALRFLGTRPLAMASAAIVLLAPLTLAANDRISDWRSPEAIWLDAYRKYPRKMRVAFNTWAALNSLQGGEYRAFTVLYDYLRGTRPGSITYEEQENIVRAAASSLVKIMRNGGGDIWSRAPELLGERNLWGDLVLLTAAMDTSSSSRWVSYWQESLERYFNLPLSLRAKEAGLIENSFYLLRGDYYARRKEWKEAQADYEKVLLPFGFGYRQIPYFTKREALADVYLQLGDEMGAIRQLQEASFQYRMFRRFPYSIYLKMNRLYFKRKDFLRASDALGQLVRVKTDDPEVRQQYAAALRAKGDKTALRQTKESEYYTEHAVPPDDIREAIRP